MKEKIQLLIILFQDYIMKSVIIINLILLFLNLILILKPNLTTNLNKYKYYTLINT